MPQSYGSEKVKCPFYEEETRNAIKCEDFIGATCKRGFKTAKLKYVHKSKYCDVLDNYMNCPHFKQVDKKYR